MIGVDLSSQPRYPGRFVRGDALEFAARHGAEFDAIHASPPCQRYTTAQRIRGNDHPDLVGPVRELLQSAGRPYVIENVPGAPMEDPILLCGAMFPGLRTYRHRLFETSFVVEPPEHPPHVAPVAKMGRRPAPGEWMHVVGHFVGADEGRRAMGIGWMTRDELRESIPPVYTEFIGAALMSVLERGRG